MEKYRSKLRLTRFLHLHRSITQLILKIKMMQGIELQTWGYFKPPQAKPIKFFGYGKQGWKGKSHFQYNFVAVMCIHQVINDL